MIKVYIDGASFGNPGKIGIGYVIYKNNEIITKRGYHLGVQSNNFAEYMALIFSLLDILGMGEKSVKVFSDSKLICEQINGNFKVKNNNIYPLFILAKSITEKFDDFSIEHIDREKNTLADKLAKKAAGLS